VAGGEALNQRERGVRMWRRESLTKKGEVKKGFKEKDHADHGSRTRCTTKRKKRDTQGDEHSLR